MVQWLRLHASTAEGEVQSLVEELRFYMPRGVAKKKKSTVVSVNFWKDCAKMAVCSTVFNWNLKQIFSG